MVGLYETARRPNSVVAYNDHCVLMTDFTVVFTVEDWTAHTLSRRAARTRFSPDQSKKK